MSVYQEYQDYQERPSRHRHYSHSGRSGFGDSNFLFEDSGETSIVTRDHGRSGDYERVEHFDSRGDRYGHDEVREQDYRRGMRPHSEDRYSRADRSRDRNEHGGHHSHRRSSSHASHEINWTQVATSAAVAGGIEAFRSRHDKQGSKRTATAAATAAIVDAFVGHDEDRKGGRHVAESVIAGLAVDRLANGKRRT